MADPITPAPAPAADPANPNPPQPDPASPPADPAPLPADVAARELEKARKDAAKYREELRKEREAREERERAEAVKKGEFEKLFGEADTERKTLRQKLEGYERTAQAARERDLVTIPEALRKFAPTDPEQFMEWLTAQRAVLATSPAPKPAPPAPTAPRPVDPSPTPKRTFTVAEIEGMSFDERSKLMPEINAAMREGRITS